MTGRFFLWLGAAWIVALVPALLDAPVKVLAAVWVVLLTVGIILPEGPRARRCVILYLLVISFPVVDYIGLPVYGFVGGAPGGMAYYPADFWLVLGLLLASAEGSLSIPRGIFGTVSLLGLLLLIAEIPSLFVATWPVAALQQWLALPRAMLAGVLVYSQANTESARRQLAWALLLGFSFQSVVAVAQHVQGTVLGLAWLGEAPAEYLAKSIAPGITLWRSGGTMGHPNVLATFLVGLLPLCVVVAVLKDERQLARPAAAIMLVLGMAAFVWTYSRGAWASLVLAIAYVSLVGVRKLLRPKVIVPLVVVGLILLMVGYPAIRHRLTQTESSATDVRFALVPVSLRMAASHPLSGIGLNHFAERIESYDPSMTLELFRHPVHNIVLLDVAEAGLIAGLISLLLWGAVLLLAALYIRSAIMSRKPLAAAFWIGAGSIVLHNAADWTLRRPDILLLLWVLVALASAASSQSQRDRQGG